VGQSITLSTQVVGGLGPTGTMTFNDGAVTLGTAAVHGGEADLVTSFSTAGTHTVTAIYSGDIASAGNIYRHQPERNGCVTGGHNLTSPASTPAVSGRPLF
jgi:hypothetical protein